MREKDRERESGRGRARERDDRQHERERQHSQRQRSRENIHRERGRDSRGGRERERVRARRSSRGSHEESLSRHRTRSSAAYNQHWSYAHQGDHGDDVDGDMDNRPTNNDGEWVQVTRRRKPITETHGVPSRPRNNHRLHRTVRWRDKADITTFYFCRFPDWVNEKELWQIFHRWGTV